MRRLLSIAQLSFVLSVLFAVFALPGFATEAEAPAEAPAETVEHAEEPVDDHAEEVVVDDHAEEAADAQDAGLWTGMKGAAAAGVLIGFVVFVTSGTAGLGGHDDHGHGDDH